jgi:hypothetical protein
MLMPLSPLKQNVVTSEIDADRITFLQTTEE